jgi:GMP synthase (glutamine-hydrolysing)
MQEHDAVAVVDFGGQYAHLIATKVRRLGVRAEIRQPEDPIEAFAPYKGIIISGSPSLASRGEDADYTRAMYDLDVPIAGFCFGHQEIAKHYGGSVIHGGREWGRTRLQVVAEHPLFDGQPREQQVWMSHFDSVASIGPEFTELALSLTADGHPEHRFAAIGSDSLQRYGFQFHPEVDDTVHGESMIASFVLHICGCRPTWTMDRYLEEQLEAIAGQVGDRSVFLLVSGGVDSTVAAALLGQALGPERLKLLHIDNGLMRLGESQRVLATLATLGLEQNLHFVDASNDFLEALAGVVDPEVKRRAIGDAFIRVFEREAERLGLRDHLLGQGTIYPDTIETGGTRRADTIKTHHNRVPVIEEMLRQGRVIEPLADLYKIEVRELGERLGVPHEVVWRHPFPGPGLGVRLLCSAGRPDPVPELDDTAGEVASRYGLETTVLPVRSVGVKADLRCYEHPVLLTGSAEWERLGEVASALLSEVDGINRVVWSLWPTAPQAASPVAATVTRERLEILRRADHAVMMGLRRHGLYELVWQCPTVLVPLDLDGQGRELVVVRPVQSKRAMTATAVELPAALLGELRDELGGLEGVSGIALDLTSKPPGTIEWE